MDTGGGSGGSGGRRLLGPRVRRHARYGVHELVRPALGRRRPERALPWHARADRGSSARVLAPVSGAQPTGAGDCCAHRGVLPRARARRLRPGSADLPHGLGADDAAVGHGDPRRAQGRQAVAADGVQLPRSHPPRRGRNLDRCSAPGQRGRVRRRGCDQLRFRPADRDRPCGSGGDGDEGRRDAAARLAPARPSDRTGSGLGADERGDDQGCAVRARARARGVGRRPPGLVRRARARRRRALCRRRASSTRSFSTISSGCWPCTRSRTSGSSCSGSAPA